MEANYDNTTEQFNCEIAQIICKDFWVFSSSHWTIGFSLEVNYRFRSSGRQNPMVSIAAKDSWVWQFTLGMYVIISEEEDWRSKCSGNPERNRCKLNGENYFSNRQCVHSKRLLKSTFRNTPPNKRAFPLPLFDPKTNYYHIWWSILSRRELKNRARVLFSINSQFERIDWQTMTNQVLEKKITNLKRMLGMHRELFLYTY